MPTTKPKTKFDPVELKAEPSWYVRVAFSSGEQTYVGGFDSEAQARNGSNEIRSLGSRHIKRANMPK
jgi:hypothetical protein